MTKNEAATWDWWSVLNAGWFGVSIGVVLALVAAIQGVILHRRGKAVARLRVAITDQLLVDTVKNAVPGRLEFTYEGIVVPRVTSTSVGLWNDGSTTFRGEDVVSKDPFRLVLTGAGRLLQASVEGESRSVIGVATHMSLENEDLLVGFDFLDPSDGFRLRLIHSGLPGSIAFAGTIKGLPAGVTTRPRPQLMPFWVNSLVFLGALFMLGTTAAAVAQAAWNATRSQLLAGAGVLVLVVAFMIAVHMYERRAKTRRIKGVPQIISDDDALFNRLTKPAGFD